MSMVAPHTLKEPLVLHVKGLPGLFKLVATDATGGVLLAHGGAQQPSTGTLLSFRPVDDVFGPVRLLAHALKPVSFPGSVNVHVAVRWAAITAAAAPAHLVRILDIMGVRVHLPDGKASIAQGRELVYEPASQRVRMIAVTEGYMRQPTADLARDGIGEQITHTQPGILVETVPHSAISPWAPDAHTDEPSDVAAQQDASSPSRAGRKMTVPGMRTQSATMDFDQDVLVAAQQSSLHRRKQTSKPLTLPNAPPVPPKLNDPEQPGPTSQGRLDRRRLRDSGSWAGGKDGDAGWRPDGLWETSGVRTSSGTYRLGPDSGAPPSDEVAVPTPRAVGPPVEIPRSNPEFLRRPASGEVTVERQSMAMTCTSLGQRSCTFEVPQFRVPIGASVRVGVPGDPYSEGVIWVTGVIEGLVVLDTTPATVQITARLDSAVPRDYRRLVQHWSRARGVW